MIDSDYRMTVEQVRGRADKLRPFQAGSWDDLACDALVAIANGCEPAREIAVAVLSAHPRVFRYLPVEAQLAALADRD